MNHVSATIGTRAVDPRKLADDKFNKRMGNFDKICKQIDAKHDHVMEMFADIQEKLRNLERKQRKEAGVNFCVGDAQSQTQPLLADPSFKPNIMISDSTSHSQKIKNENLPSCEETQTNQPIPPSSTLVSSAPSSSAHVPLESNFTLESTLSPPLQHPHLLSPLSSTAFSLPAIETLTITTNPKPQNLSRVVVKPTASAPKIHHESGALPATRDKIEEIPESYLGASNIEKIETNLVEIGVQAMEEMSEWVVVFDSTRSAEQTNPSREILQQIKASSDTKKTKCSQAIHLVKRITFNRSSISTETIHRFLSGQFLHSRILAEWAEEPPDIPNYQPSPFKGKPNTLQEKMAAKILVISPMLNVFDEMTERELSSSKEVTVCMDLGEKIHAHMKTDLYRVSVATSGEDFGKKCNEAMQVFDPGGSALDVRVLKVGDSLLEVFYASWLRIKWDSKKIYDWVWQSLFICSYV